VSGTRTITKVVKMKPTVIVKRITVVKKIYITDTGCQPGMIVMPSGRCAVPGSG
jgi:hypothetical protein